MKRLKPVTLIFVAISLVFVLCLPALWQSLQQENKYHIWLHGEEPAWQGILSLWHIVEWKTGKESGVNYLKNVAMEYERSTPGIFIETQGLTAKEAEKKLKAGEMPDLISFPLGFDALPELETMTMPAHMKPALAASALLNGHYCALPYMMGGYLLMANRELLYESQIELPLDGVWEAGTLREAVAACTRADSNGEGAVYGLACANERYTFSQAALLLYQQQRIAGRQEEILHEDAYEAFAQGKAALLLGSHYAYETAIRASTEGMLDFEMYTLNNYTDMVQYIGIPAGENKAKQAVCHAFATYLLSEKWQKRLETMDVFPVLNMSIYESSLYELEDMLADPLVPNTFAWAGQRESMLEASKSCLYDDETAQRILNSLYKVLSR